MLASAMPWRENEHDKEHPFNKKLKKNLEMWKIMRIFAARFNVVIS